MSRLQRTFRRLKTQKKAAFIAFITAGFPDLKTTENLILEFSRIGVDIIELGVPFSDPMADGPVIQAASQHALKNGITLPLILQAVKRVRGKTEVPICLMTYYNPVFCYNEERFVKDAVVAGVDGVIIPDLPPEEGAQFLRESSRRGLDVIQFIAPTTSPERMKYIVKKAKGFIYYVSLTGVTGARKALPGDLALNLALIKSKTKKPVCVGFGVSDRNQVKQLARISDGVIVGSAIVKNIRDNLSRPGLVKNVSRFVSHLKGSPFHV